MAWLLQLLAFVFLFNSLCCPCHSFSIRQSKWMFQNQYPVAYERAEVLSTDSSSRHSSEDIVSILLLNGFGMGSFHQHRLMKELLSPDIVSERKHQNLAVYGMDYLGQGQSWPLDCKDGFSESEQGLCYSGRTWVNQIIQFIEEIMLPEAVANDLTHAKRKPRRVHLVGNSLGGYLAVCAAAERPDLVESLCLLNATPIWGLNLPGWSGKLPAPLVPRLIGRVLFDAMRDTRTITQFLQATYVNEAVALDSPLVTQIQSSTNGPGGHAAFASILWSPPVAVQLPTTSAALEQVSQATNNFYDCLRALQCDVLLVFGRDDPWCKPAFAKRMLEQLQRRSVAVASRYIELTKVGHCPNHEAPKATALVLTEWLTAECSKSRKQCPLLSGTKLAVAEDWGVTVLEELSSDQIPLGLIEKLAVTFI
jgi:pimeloyl-ACP methyl ester carboxylesterase